MLSNPHHPHGSARRLFALLLLVALPCGSAYSQWKLVAANAIPTSGSSGIITHIEDVLWAGGNDLQVSTDFGVTWEVRNPPTFSTGDIISSIAFFDKQRGLFATSRADIYSTVDGGMNWKQLRPFSVPVVSILSVGFIDSPECFAFTAYQLSPIRGYVYVTTDGGSTWNNKQIAEFTYSVACKGKTLYATGGDKLGSHLFKTTNYGQSWTKQPGSYDWDSYTFAFDSCMPTTFYVANEDAAVPTDDLSCVYVSRDEGVTWVVKDQHPINYHCGSISTAGKAIFTQTYTGVTRSTDHGDSWKEIGGPPNNYDTRFFTALSENVIFAVDPDGSVWRTFNSGGDSLTSFPSNIKAMISTQRIINDTIGATVWMPIILKRSAQVPNFDLTLHYDSVQLTYVESVTPNGKVVDIAGMKWKGRSKLHFASADLPPITDTIIGYSKFLFYPFEPLCANLSYDSLLFEEINCSSGVASNHSAYGTIGSYKSCGLSSVNTEPIIPAAHFDFTPNPAHTTGTLLSRDYSGEIQLQIFDTKGALVKSLSDNIIANAPFAIGLGDLSTGAYFMQIVGKNVKGTIAIRIE